MQVFLAMRSVRINDVAVNVYFIGRTEDDTNGLSFIMEESMMTQYEKLMNALMLSPFGLDGWDMVRVIIRNNGVL